MSSPRHTAGLDDTQYRTLKSKLPKYRLKKRSMSPSFYGESGARFIDGGEICEFIETGHSHLPCFALCRKTTPKKQRRAAKPYKMVMNWAQIHTERATKGPASLRKYNLFLYLRFNNYIEFLIQKL